MVNRLRFLQCSCTLEGTFKSINYFGPDQSIAVQGLQIRDKPQNNGSMITFRTAFSVEFSQTHFDDVNITFDCLYALIMRAYRQFFYISRLRDSQKQEEYENSGQTNFCSAEFMVAGFQRGQTKFYRK